MKIRVCVLFGGVSPEHDVSLRSAESVLNHIDHEKYDVLPVGITKTGKWVLYSGNDYSKLPSGQWLEEDSNIPVVISPVSGQGLIVFRGESVSYEKIDVVFPVLHGENGEDGTVQGLLRLAGIPFVGPDVAASAVAMDKSLTKLVMEHISMPVADWVFVRPADVADRIESVIGLVEERFSYPVFVKPAGTGSSVGISKAFDRESLVVALHGAAQYDEKILVEEYVRGREIEVAVMGNENPVASICGEIDSGSEFYDYDAKYVTDTSVAYIPARISAETEEQVREYAISAYKAIGCKGLSRVDFFVTFDDERIVFNEINTLPGFTSISMYPKLFGASGIDYEQLIDMLLEFAMESVK